MKWLQESSNTMGECVHSLPETNIEMMLKQFYLNSQQAIEYTQIYIIKSWDFRALQSPEHRLSYDTMLAHSLMLAYPHSF